MADDVADFPTAETDDYSDFGPASPTANILHNTEWPVLSDDEAEEIPHPSTAFSDANGLGPISNFNMMLVERQKKHMSNVNGHSQRTQVEESAKPIDENSWMEETQNLDEDDEAEKAKFKAAVEAFKKKRESGDLSLLEELEFVKFEREHEKKSRRIEEEASIEMREELAALGTEFGGMQEDDNLLIVPEFPRQTRVAKRAREDMLDAMTFHDFADRGEEDDEKNKLEQFQNAPKASTKAKKAKTSEAKSKTKGKAKPDATKPDAKNSGKGKEKAKPPTKKEIAATRAANNVSNVSNLLNSSVFRDTATNTGTTLEPGFTATNKVGAMKELLSSLPAEHREIGKMDRKQLLMALKLFTGKGSCQSDGRGQWKVHGMISVLSHYQMLGVSVMRDRETQLEEPRGGILADQMGLGKTVMMIANIVNGMKTPGGPHGPTLIVAPPSLLFQWQAELEKHADKKVLGDVIRHHHGHRLATSDPVAGLSKYNVILTTYHEIGKSYPVYNPPPEAITTDEKEEWWKKCLAEKCGTLHRIKFHRVILDEAQAIKNHNSRTSIGCRGLVAKHRWAISGTPVQNSLSEFFPYFKFLQVPFTGSFTVFKRNFCSHSDTQGVERLGLYLRKFMIRRTHSDTLFGARLLSLPAPTRIDLPCEFSHIEREIYNVVRTRFILRINGMSRAGQLKKNYSHILTMLLRLRQVVGHPLLIQDTLRDLLEPEDFHKLKKITQMPVPPQSTQAALLHHLRLMLRSPQSLIQLEVALKTPEPASSFAEAVAVPYVAEEPASGEIPEAVDDSHPTAAQLIELAGIIDKTDPTTPSNAPNAISKMGKAFGLKNSYAEYLEDLLRNTTFVEEDESLVCLRCGDTSTRNRITSCGHVFCLQCLYKMSHASALKNQDYSSCPECGAHYTVAHTYNGPEHTGPSAGSAHDPTASSASQDRNNDAEKPERPKKLTAQQVVDTWVDAEGHMLPSAKTLAIKAQILNWMQESPGCKIIIYSQFITMIRILSKMCAIEKWAYVSFTGLQTMERRAIMVKDFETKPDIPIMIASLKAGGVGLNLTCASKVLIVDLWWNSAVEDQAFCRSYRRGQLHSTYLTRLCVTNTIDTDMISMQRRKDDEIGGVMATDPDGVDAGGKSFSMQDLLELFGTRGTDENGNDFILVDDREANKERPRWVGEEGEGGLGV